MAMGKLMLSDVGRNLLMERGGRDHDLGAGGNSNGNGKGSSMDEKLADHQRAAERDERGSRQCQGEGGQFPSKTRGNLDPGGHAGAMMLAFKSFFLSRILSSAKTFP